METTGFAIKKFVSEDGELTIEIITSAKAGKFHTINSPLYYENMKNHPNSRIAKYVGIYNYNYNYNHTNIYILIKAISSDLPLDHAFRISASEEHGGVSKCDFEFVTLVMVVFRLFTNAVEMSFPVAQVLPPDLTFLPVYLVCFWL